MHMRGKGMTLEAINLDNTTTVLSSVDHFDFNWHVNYVYADEAAPLLPAGTVLHIIGIHDNTAATGAIRIRTCGPASANGASTTCSSSGSTSSTWMTPSSTGWSRNARAAKRDESSTERSNSSRDNRAKKRRAGSLARLFYVRCN